ncbi:ATP synthase subunit C lysine N-methyltransferase-like isoform X2 [Trichomycterus rosablanca]|uniref:ATP synthase subunit C lysine N-methyltransferase-like isoform X2 n=1 Tax=Trichomycterus rosablanca TaxID=2290929 RepID=UPI002F35D6F9
MEDSIEIILQDRSFKSSYQTQNNPAVTAASGTLLMTFYGLRRVFALPGFRKVPINLKVPYLPSSGVQTQNVVRLLQGRTGSLADLGSGDGRLTNLSQYKNVTVFLAPGVMEVLGRKLEKDLAHDAMVVACCFPFPKWHAAASEGLGLDQVWAYDMAAVRKLLK